MAKDEHAASGGRKREGAGAAILWTLIGVMLAVALVAALGASAGLVSGGSPDSGQADRVRQVAAPATLTAERAERVARRVSAAHADVTAVWSHDLRWRHGRSYAPPAIITFSGRRPSPCAIGSGVSGLVYCPLDRTLSVDLAFLADLAEALGGEGERALALLVARGAASHLQAELAILGDADRLRREASPEGRAELDLEVALQADCLAGIWARRARRHVGEVPAGTWTSVVAGMRAASAEAASAARLDLGAVALREEAFGHGYDNGQVEACLTPALSGVLG